MVSIFEGDDGEEFKVKKSSYSKKIKKQMSKEKMGRDKIENGKKSKVIICDTIRPIVKETQTNLNVIHNYWFSLNHFYSEILIFIFSLNLWKKK